LCNIIIFGDSLYDITVSLFPFLLNFVDNNFKATVLKLHEELKTLWENNRNKERTFTLHIMKEKRKTNNKRKQVMYKQSLQKGKNEGL
jgi:hypothetical protein